MKYRFLIRWVIFFLIIFSGGSQAQQVLVSPESLDDFSLGFNKVIGYDESGYFMLTSNLSLNSASDHVGFKSRKYKVAYYTKSLVKKWDQSVNPIPENGSLDAISFFNDRILVVSSVYEKSSGQAKYYFSFINNEGKIQSGTGPAAGFLMKSDDFSKCKVVISLSKEKVAIVALDYSENDKQIMNVAVMDDQLRVESNKKTTIPFSPKTFDFTGLVLSNNGDIAILGTNTEKIKPLSSRRRTDYYLYVSPASSGEFREFAISDSKSITGLGIEFDNLNHQAVVAGFYSEKESYVGAGIYYATLPMEGDTTLHVITKGIDQQQNIRLIGERNAGAGMSLVSYPIDRIILRADGGAVIIAEAAYTTEFSYYDSFSQSYTRRIEYHFDNIIVISINNEGKADWSAVVEKNQVSLDDGGVLSSFSSLLNSGQLIFLFNDNIGKRNKIIPVALDNLGHKTRLKSYQSEGTLLLPRSGKQVSENEMVVPALVRRKLYLLKFSF